MADLHFVHFPFMPGPVTKEMQFKQPCDFSKIDVTSFSGMSHPVSGFPVVFHNADGPMFGNPYYTKRAKREIMKNFNISVLRGRNHCLLAAVM